MPVTLTPFPPVGAPPVEGNDDDSRMMAARLKFARPISGWFRNLYNLLRPGATKDVVISGTTLHFVNGIFTGSSP